MFPQGWNIFANPSSFSPAFFLRVFIVPHSHNDIIAIKTMVLNVDYYH